jgi:hypothetical protein
VRIQKKLDLSATSFAVQGLFVFSAATVSALAESIPRTPKVVLRFSVHFLGLMPQGARGLSPRFQPWEPSSDAP